MIIAGLALLLQADPAGPPLDAQAVSEGFRSICVRHVADPVALRRAIRHSPLRFVRDADEGRFEVYRSAEATVRFQPGTGCAFDARLASRSEGDRAIGQISAAIGTSVPPGAVNHPGTGARYRWEPAGESRTGLVARLNWGLDDSDLAPVTLYLWAFRRPAP